MTRRRNMRSTGGVLDFAACLDWKDYLGLAAITAFIGAMLVPALFAGSAVLRSVGTVLSQFAWLTVFVFLFLAVARFRKGPPAPCGTMRIECEENPRNA